MSSAFEPISPPTGRVFESAGQTAIRPPSAQQVAVSNTHKQARCAVCGNVVDAIVLEKTAMLVKYRCTHPGCGALFSEEGSVAKMAKGASKVIAVANIAIGVMKLVGGDHTGIADIFHGGNGEA